MCQGANACRAGTLAPVGLSRRAQRDETWLTDPRQVVLREVASEAVVPAPAGGGEGEGAAAAGRRPAVPAGCPAALVGLMSDAWHREPKMRPAFAEVHRCV